MCTSRSTYATFTFFILSFTFYIFSSSCSLQQQIARSARQVITDSSLRTAHVGISIYEPATGKYWYDYQGDHYFVPASNTKIPTCYAAMKYLGDSLTGLRYGYPEEKGLKDKMVVIQPAGDPTFLLPEYKHQPVYDFLKQKLAIEKRYLGFMDTTWKEERWGSGWSWNDYDAAYMAERNSLPVYGNVLNVSLYPVRDRPVGDTSLPPGYIGYRLFKTQHPYFDSLVNQDLRRISSGQLKKDTPYVKLTRSIAGNFFLGENTNRPFSDLFIPFFTNRASTALAFFQELFHTELWYITPTKEKNEFEYDCRDCDIGTFHINQWHAIHSQPTDSLLAPMMHRSDNFFAEQALLMVSNERLGIMNDERIIDTLLAADLEDLPQKPRWVDGSGLSRYNLFTPQDFVVILDKMRKEFGMDRVRSLFPTGGEGTLGSYYRADSGYIYAKTGTLSGVVALSGFLYTHENRLLIFSVLVNNHRSPASAVRRAIGQFLRGIRRRH